MIFAGFFLAKDSLERTATKRTLKIKETRPKVEVTSVLVTIRLLTKKPRDP